MSSNYADSLSPYENKGILGIPECFDSDDTVSKKCTELANLIKDSRHVVFHTGAGISTSAGIPDFRGPKGVWTLEKKGEIPKLNTSFDNATPTKTHMALRALVEAGYVQYIVSQNIDGLHLRSGLKRRYLSELHGNIFIEQCATCRRQFVRSTSVKSVGQKALGIRCRSTVSNVGRACRTGYLHDNVLDWEHDLPQRDLDMAVMHSTMADLNITLGTTLQIVPSGNLPLKNIKGGGKLVICNLQPTKHDSKAHLVISSYVDEILSRVCNILGIEISEYSESSDPTTQSNLVEWTLPLNHINIIERKFKTHLKETVGCNQKKNPE
ncbi:NAD-dependent protein deacetylase Sirt6 [Drosophila pseudoobscura]|uniref:protein acetyllysine N-acetyltransferase n=1 Tax=Drosophila pseudoobscura pseudoobscura TaxID=46245 RepID=A0A6I8VZL8_DROPS|nr:NAD-dependent protein deacetylase Sirt6 [Drosophila pseudoobscura]XP_033236539.1 NAD-dependent protein deacetylase Sirt6 [Drosophila pseudoobscura]XP_033236540.1 NAD-dependent protein deacetylase Sirt6 [Drosophila pseudoobscura]